MAKRVCSVDSSLDSDDGGISNVRKMQQWLRQQQPITTSVSSEPTTVDSCDRSSSFTVHIPPPMTLQLSVDPNTNDHVITITTYHDDK